MPSHHIAAIGLVVMQHPHALAIADGGEILIRMQDRGAQHILRETDTLHDIAHQEIDAKALTE